MQGNYDKLEILHHLTSGLKAIISDYTYNAMDEMRQACGGAGYHIASGVATNFQNNCHLVIVEGVYPVMMQQSSRYLLKQLTKLSEGKRLVGYLAYLNDTDALISTRPDVKTVDQFLDFQNLSRTLATRAAHRLKELQQMISSSTASH